MTDSEALYQGNFKYIFVPVDNSQAIAELEASKAGGLEKDALRLLAEEHFTSTVKSISSSVEIVSLLLPVPDFNFISISMYCDQVGKSKNLPINTRATSIATLCHHKDPIHGDVFFGKAHDDESKPWIRLDFTLADLSSDADWVKVAQVKNVGKKGAYSTSGVLQSMMKQGNTQYIDSNQVEEVGNDSSSSDKVENDALSWNQTSDEVEVKVAIVGKLKASDLDIKIKSNRLQIRLKSGQTIPNSNQGKVSKLFMEGGAELFGRIDVEASTWQIEKSKDNENTTIVVTLSKDTSMRWLDLLSA